MKAGTEPSAKGGCRLVSIKWFSPSEDISALLEAPGADLDFQNAEGKYRAQEGDSQQRPGQSDGAQGSVPQAYPSGASEDCADAGIRPGTGPLETSTKVWKIIRRRAEACWTLRAKETTSAGHSQNEWTETVASGMLRASPTLSSCS